MKYLKMNYLMPEIDVSLLLENKLASIMSFNLKLLFELEHFKKAKKSKFQILF
jgi:hypothetical protein